MNAPIHATAVRWVPSANVPSFELRCTFSTGKGRGYLQRVMLAPGARTALVQASPDEDKQLVRFYDTSTWQERWNVPLPAREPGTGGRKVGAAFLSPHRYVLAHREVLLGEDDRIVWRTFPPVPSEWRIDHLRQYESAREWELIGNDDPIVDADHVYVGAHWAKYMGSSSYFHEGEWEDRYAVEILALDDGRWIRREEVVAGSSSSVVPPKHSPEFTREDDRVHLVRDGVTLGTLEAVTGRSIVDVDVSHVDCRMILAMDDAELLFFEIGEV